jgi:hypothetical protein
MAGDPVSGGRAIARRTISLGEYEFGSGDISFFSVIA